MKAKWIKWSLVSMFIMIGLPWLAVTFAPADAGMAICLLLFYVVNPFYSLVLGGMAGQKPRSLWMLPLLVAGLFLAGAGIFFTLSEPFFFIYAGIYFVLGELAMLIVFIVNKMERKIQRKS